MNVENLLNEEQREFKLSRKLIYFDTLCKSYLNNNKHLEEKITFENINKLAGASMAYVGEYYY